MFGISIQVSEKLIYFLLKLNNLSKLKVEKKFFRGGGHLKNDVITKGGSKIMTHDDKGGGGSNFPKMEVT